MLWVRKGCPTGAILVGYVSSQSNGSAPEVVLNQKLFGNQVCRSGQRRASDEVPCQGTDHARRPEIPKENECFWVGSYVTDFGFFVDARAKAHKCLGRLSLCRRRSDRHSWLGTILLPEESVHNDWNVRPAFLVGND